MFTHRNHLRCVERKGAIYAALNYFEKAGQSIPIMISGTITDASGRLLSGQTVGAFWNAVRHASPMSIGFNCALGAAELHSYTHEISRLADCYVSAYPNRGLPNEFGEYDETIEEMTEAITAYLDEGMVNLIGGCCGTTGSHRCFCGLSQVIFTKKSARTQSQHVTFGPGGAHHYRGQSLCECR